MRTLDTIHLRDPFILPVTEDGLYYLYGTDGFHGVRFDVYKSADLVNWDGPTSVFDPAPDFWATQDFWAPEVHRYQGRYYMFASFKADGACRGTQILIADSPEGPFTPHSDGPVTPRDWESLDGTLFVDDAGTPWIVFCHEWVQVGNGEICALRLLPDLSAPVGEPVLLFTAHDAPWVKGIQDGPNYVTDGPFVRRTRGGDLIMLWSSFDPDYAMGVARSTSGKIGGPWEILPEVVHSGDGGHGMLFETFAGELMMTVHTPNSDPDERPIIIPVAEESVLW